MKAEEACRSAASTEAGECGHYLLHMPLSGSLQVGLHGREVCANVGDICVFDPAQLSARSIEAAASLSIAISRPALEKAVGLRHLHGIVLRAHGAMTPAISALLFALSSPVSPLSDTQGLAAQDAIAALVAVALKEQRPSDFTADPPALGAGLRQRIVDFVTRNVQLLELSPDFLCRHFKVSRAHLYRAFASDGGVAKVLRDIRLDAAYRELTQPARSMRSITEIAYSLGFSSGNQLLRTFRERFGMTPSEARASKHA